MTFEEAVNKMTSLPAERLGLEDRGVLSTGNWADLVVFDPQRVLDQSTFQNPDVPSEGIVMTMVNGTIVWRNNQPAGQFPGRVLKRK
jgi:N-acyl-D-aspartate/D-glutamate deacylase